MDSVYRSKLYQNYRSLLVTSVDVSLVLFAYVFMFFANNNFFFEQRVLHFTKGITLATLGMLALHFLVLRLCRTDKFLWMYIGTYEVVNYFLATIISMILMLLFSYQVGLFHASLIVLAELLSFFMQMGIRLAYRRWRRFVTSSGTQRNALIVGAGAAGYMMLNEIYRNSRYPYHVVGFVDDYKKKGTIISGKQVLGTIDEIKRICIEMSVDQIFISAQSLTPDEKKRIINLCAETSVNTKMMRFDMSGQQRIEVEDIKIEDLLNRPTIDLQVDEIGSYLTDQVVAVTGAGGSIGSELCRQIIRFKPRRLLLIDINENSLYMLEQEFLRLKRAGKMDQSIETVSLIASIRERDAMGQLFAHYHPVVVYHAAAHKHVPLMETRPSEAILNNIIGTKNVIEACDENGVKRFILISTDKAVNPTNVMGATKRMTEIFLQSYVPKSSLILAAVRFGNVLGSNGSVIPIFKEQIKSGGPLTLTDRQVKRYFMTIPEAAQLVLQAGFYAQKQEIFVLDMGQPVKILDLAENMIRLAGLRPYEDIDIIEIGLRPGEKMFEELALEIEQCHRTDNQLIFVHEPMAYDPQLVDQNLSQLKAMALDEMSPKVLKSALMDAIQMPII